MSVGLPCIVSNLEGGDDAIDNGKNGFVFQVGNDKEPSEKILWFINNRDKISQMGKYSSSCVKKYTWEIYY